MTNATAKNTATLERFPIWKTIKLGLHKDAASYVAALIALGCEFNAEATVLREEDRFTEEIEVDLVKVIAGEFGSTEDTSYLYKDVCSRGIEAGLTLCPVEVALALRLVHDVSSAKRDESLIIAMKPTTYCDPRVLFKYGEAFLVVRHEKGTLFLEGCVPGSEHSRGYPDSRHLYHGNPDDEYIFIRPRSK